MIRAASIRVILAIGAVMTLCDQLSAQSSAAPSGQAHLRLKFLRDGHPIRATAVVADGATRLEFRDVFEIDTFSPRIATLSVQTSGDGGPAFKDVIPFYETVDDRLVEVHLPTRKEPGAYEPTLLFIAAGSAVDVDNEFSAVPAQRKAFTLSTRMRGTAGASVILDAIQSIDNAPNAHLCLPPCDHAYPSAASGTDSWYTCSSTSVLYHGYWKANYNMCPYFTTGSAGTDSSVAEVVSTFVPIRPGQAGLNLAAVLVNDGAFNPKRATLKNLESEEQFEVTKPTRAYPNFVAPAGRYLFTVTLHDERSLMLPIRLDGGAISTLLLSLPSSSAPYSAAVVGDTRLGLALSLSGVERTGESAMVVRTSLSSANGNDDSGWVQASLPGAVPAPVVRERRGATVATLQQDRDFAVDVVGDVTLVTLLVRPGQREFDIGTR